MVPVLVFLFAAGLTFSAIYIDALRTGAGLTMPHFVRAILPDPALGLRVEFQGDHLLVSWNRQSSTVREAVAGVLRIEDGGERRNVHLDGTQVAAGSILYKPASDDVTFRLELYGDQGNTTVESMRVLAPRDSAAPSPSAPAAVKPETAPKRVPENPPPSKEHAEGKLHPRAIPETPAAPSAAADTNAAADRDDALPSPAQSAPPAHAPQHARQYVPPVSTPPSATMTRSSAGPAPDIMPDGKTLSLFKPARPLRQVMPNAAVLRTLAIYKPTQVTIRVTIDPTGHVTKTELMPGEAKLSSGLPAAALAAAREWRFEPATLRGIPIESQHSIVFAFQPPHR